MSSATSRGTHPPLEEREEAAMVLDQHARPGRSEPGHWLGAGIDRAGLAHATSEASGGRDPGPSLRLRGPAELSDRRGSRNRTYTAVRSCTSRAALCCFLALVLLAAPQPQGSSCARRNHSSSTCSHLLGSCTRVSTPSGGASGLLVPKDGRAGPIFTGAYGGRVGAEFAGTGSPSIDTVNSRPDSPLT